MDDTADKPWQPTSAEPKLRTVSDEELRHILDNHKKLLAADDKTGLDHLRADLSGSDLRWHLSLADFCEHLSQSLPDFLSQGGIRGTNCSGPTSAGPDCRVRGS